MTIFLVIFGVCFIIVLTYVVIIYNRLIRQAKNIRDAWSNTLTSLSKRHDAVKNLVKTVEKSSIHEKDLQIAIVATSRGDIGEVNISEKPVSKAITILVESQPKLTAGANFKDLFSQLVAVENDVQGNRLVYNRAVATYLTTLRTFPVSFVAYGFRFVPVEFFDPDPDQPQS